MRLFIGTAKTPPKLLKKSMSFLITFAYDEIAIHIPVYKNGKSTEIQANYFTFIVSLREVNTTAILSISN